MTRAFTRLAFSEAVKETQRRYGTREHGMALERKDPANDALVPEIAAYIRERDSFFIATASLEGWPHLQHRGGPKGFLKVRDERTLAFGDFDGNRQFITLGNLAENDRVCLFVPNYATGQRLKIWGRARVADGPPELLEQMRDPDYPAAVKRIVLIRVEAWDFNCRQHIRRRLDEAEVAAAIDEAWRRLSAGAPV